MSMLGISSSSSSTGLITSDATPECGSDGLKSPLIDGGITRPSTGRAVSSNSEKRMSWPETRGEETLLVGKGDGTLEKLALASGLGSGCDGDADAGDACIVGWFSAPVNPPTSGGLMTLMRKLSRIPCSSTLSSARNKDTDPTCGRDRTSGGTRG
jgi:hypothetical protein